MSNQVQKVESNQNKVVTVKDLLGKNSYKKRFRELLQDRSEAFMTSIINISNSPQLKNATPQTVISSCVVAATLDLPIDQNLGFAYIVPYNNNKKIDGKWVKTKEAQFQMGYKGFIQLALRSGQYKTINAVPVYDGEIKKNNRVTGEIDFVDDDSNIDFSDENIIGYIAYFKLLNGFEKTLYMTNAQLQAHAKKYSQSYKYDLDQKKTTSRWSVDFQSMALKTVLKLLISKYGPLSVKMQEALTKDQSVDDGNGVNYVDNQVAQEIEENANSEVIDVDFEDVQEVKEEKIENTPKNKNPKTTEVKEEVNKTDSGQQTFNIGVDDFGTITDEDVPF